MRKILVLAMLVMAGLWSQMSAQTPEELNASKDRYAKLEKLVKKGGPKETGLVSVDGLAVGSTAIMAESLQITPLLENLYARSIGETKEGVTDVSVKKPTLEECMVLSARIGKQALAAKATSELVQNAASEVKGLKNPMAAAKAVKSLDYSKDVIAIVGLESVYQAKAIESIIATIKSADNL